MLVMYEGEGAIMKQEWLSAVGLEGCGREISMGGVTNIKDL